MDYSYSKFLFQWFFLKKSLNMVKHCWSFLPSVYLYQPFPLQVATSESPYTYHLNMNIWHQFLANSNCFQYLPETMMVVNSNLASTRVDPKSCSREDELRTSLLVSSMMHLTAISTRSNSRASTISEWSRCMVVIHRANATHDMGESRLRAMAKTAWENAVDNDSARSTHIQSCSRPNNIINRNAAPNAHIVALWLRE